MSAGAIPAPGIRPASRVKELDTDDDQQHGQQEQRSGADDLIVDQPVPGKFQAHQHAQRHRNNAGNAEQVHGALAVVGQEENGDEVEESLEEPFQTVLGFAPRARVMLDRQFGDSKPLCGRKHGREPMQLAVDADGVGDFAAIRLEATVEVVELDAGNGAHRPVEELARRCLAPGILAVLFPT
ncbi:MAG: hypothetical protein R2848_03300 [Thermomicrobiales bacterium]